MQNTYEQFSGIITSTISLHAEFINRDLPHWNNLLPHQWAKEIGTLHISLGRQTGKTTYIIQHGYDVFDTMVIVANTSMKRLFRGRSNVFTIHEVMRSPTPWEFGKYNTVYVDEPEMCFKGFKVDDVYGQICTQHHATRFILLGH